MLKTGGDKFVSSYYGVTYTPHLSHHGIKGMKWGIRRYQNPDGTLTEEGRLRYGQIVDRGRELQDRGKTANKIAVKAVINHGMMYAGKVAADWMLGSVAEVLLSGVTLSNPVTAAGKVAFDLAFAGLQIKNMTDAVKDIRAIETADKVKETNEELKARAERTRIQADIASNSKKARDARNDDGGKGGKSPSIIDDPGGFMKSKAEKLASDVFDAAIRRASDKVQGNKNDDKNNKDKDDNDGGKKKKKKGGNDGGNEGNNKKDDPRDRTYDIDDVLAHPEKYTPAQVEAAINSDNKVRSARSAAENREKERKAQERAEREAREAREAQEQAEKEERERERRERIKAGEEAARAALRDARGSGRSLNYEEYRAIRDGRASYIGRDYVNNNMDWMMNDDFDW